MNKNPLVISAHAFLVCAIVARNPWVRLGSLLTYILSVLNHSGIGGSLVCVVDIVVNYLIATVFIVSLILHDTVMGICLAVSGFTLATLFWTGDKDTSEHAIIHASVACMILIYDRSM